MTRASISGAGNLEDICPETGTMVAASFRSQANGDGDDNAGGGSSVAVPRRGVTTCDSTMAM
jgi:hypothetical protein